MNMDHSDNQEEPCYKLLFDPVPYSGGSKIAAREILDLCNEKKTHITVLTSDKTSWKNNADNRDLSVLYYSLPTFVHAKTTGLGYWCKQIILLMVLCFTLIKLRLNQQKVTTLIGISGPGVDLALYLCQFIARYEVVQLIQGPVALSRSIGYCLTKATKVFYLSSSKPTIIAALERYFASFLSQTNAKDFALFHATGANLLPFDNGLNQQRWPTPCEYADTHIFWAASLLKWKGLDVLLSANKIIGNHLKLQYHICYIRPEQTNAETISAPQNDKGLHWYEKPSNLDEIRSRCSIFISTSQNEPFGLSILESLAAGLCVIIPSDNAYWDKALEDGNQCLKYQANNPESLANTLRKLAYQPQQIQKIGQAGQRLAQNYQASICYQHIVTEFTGSFSALASSSVPLTPKPFTSRAFKPKTIAPLIEPQNVNSAKLRSTKLRSKA